MDSNSLSLKIPVLFMDTPKGAKHIAVNTERLRYYLNLSSSDTDALADTGLGIPICLPKTPRTRINRLEDVQEYQALLDTGTAKNKSDIGRQKDVSRAWVTKVIRTVTTPWCCFKRLAAHIMARKSLRG